MKSITKTLTLATYTPFQREGLEKLYYELEREHLPSCEEKKKIDAISEVIGLTRDQIRMWLRNRKKRGAYKGRPALAVEQVRVLEWIYLNHSHYPSPLLKKEVGAELNLSYYQVQKWFETRRQRGAPALLTKVEVKDTLEWELTLEKLKLLIALDQKKDDKSSSSSSSSVAGVSNSSVNVNRSSTPSSSADNHQQAAKDLHLKRHFIPDDSHSLQAPEVYKRQKREERDEVVPQQQQQFLGGDVPSAAYVVDQQEMLAQQHHQHYLAAAEAGLLHQQQQQQQGGYPLETQQQQQHLPPLLPSLRPGSSSSFDPHHPSSRKTVLYVQQRQQQQQQNGSTPQQQQQHHDPSSSDLYYGSGMTHPTSAPSPNLPSFSSFLATNSSGDSPIKKPVLPSISTLLQHSSAPIFLGSENPAAAAAEMNSGELRPIESCPPTVEHVPQHRPLTIVNQPNPHHHRTGAIPSLSNQFSQTYVSSPSTRPLFAPQPNLLPPPRQVQNQQQQQQQQQQQPHHQRFLFISDPKYSK
eukprot:CAMPEP_0201477354 /NCGR_PEP_ID=MMETSP0151_2-20130828/2381_1 /ASSEMBLY_ACC=CAM_ASM_000257 /TAXON_ID=200890 /ORGANISM="Paramoeba atlantica, Strain 621/1 / CCAP 1560/9" /LENGTH=522 /DNA_ID=CAMNT_0047858037 /DNA_START=120 /DNA_END=1688 /DNA_ORIENTATION=-